MAPHPAAGEVVPTYIRQRKGASRTFDPLSFVANHGVVLASARGLYRAWRRRSPASRSAGAGGPIRGQEIFGALSTIDDSPDVLSFKLVGGKVTFVRRRLWPALVRLADEIGPERLARVQQEHTDSGRHRTLITPFPNWVPRDVRAM